MVGKASSFSFSFKKSVLLSVIALFEIAVLVIVACFGWIEHGPAEFKADKFVIRSGYGFNFFNEDGSAVDELIIKADGELSDCSTVDGRRLYFPILGSANGSKDAASSVTQNGDNLTYRAATEVDQEKYIDISFQVISIADSSIDVYVDPESYIQNNGADLTCARITFNSNDGKAPVTVCPGSTPRTNKCLTLDANGEARPSSGNATYQPINIAESATPATVFTLPQNTVKTITMQIWLDGFDKDCDDALVGADNTKMLIKFGVKPSAG